MPTFNDSQTTMSLSATPATSLAGIDLSAAQASVELVGSEAAGTNRSHAALWSEHCCELYWRLNRGLGSLFGFNSNPSVITAVLLSMVIISGVLTVYGVQQSRLLFIELKTLQAEQDQAQLKWTQLLLEESALNAPGRVEQIATSHLGMVVPTAKQVEMVK